MSGFTQKNLLLAEHMLKNEGFSDAVVKPSGDIYNGDGILVGVVTRCEWNRTSPGEMSFDFRWKSYKPLKFINLKFQIDCEEKK